MHHFTDGHPQPPNTHTDRAAAGVGVVPGHRELRVAHRGHVLGLHQLLGPPRGRQERLRPHPRRRAGTEEDDAPYQSPINPPPPIPTGPLTTTPTRATPFKKIKIKIKKIIKKVGALAGSTLATRATYLSLSHLYTVGGLTPCFMALLVRKYTRSFGHILPPEALQKGAYASGHACMHACIEKGAPPGPIDCPSTPRRHACSK